MLLAAGILYYGYKRVNRAGEIEEHDRREMREDEAEANVIPRYPYAAAKDHIWDKTVWAVNEPGLARTGRYGFERRDYINQAGGTRIPTYTDHWVNV